ncbi:SH3 domain-containing protein [Salinarimonas sp.]|uniref:SH3 domain-containing protein n=1 Tax=Salinarimonas sp. TaxID=2766526 RepID=UPI00391C4428
MIAAGALALGMAMPGGVANAQEVLTTADVNLREGPGTRFDVIRSIPNEGRLDSVYGCLPDRDWCEVQYRGARGWVFADYLQVTQGGQRLGVIGQVGPGMGLPTVAFDEERWRQQYDGVQPRADQRFAPQREVPDAVAGTRDRWDDERWRQQYDGVQPNVDQRFAPQRGDVPQTGAVARDRWDDERWRQQYDGVQPRVDQRYEPIR